MRLCRRFPARLRPIHAVLVAAGLCFAVAPSGCGKKTAEQRTDGTKTVADTKPGDGKKITAKAGTPEAEVHAALDDAIAVVKKHDLKAFVEMYIPVLELRELRRKYGSTSAFARKAMSSTQGAKRMEEMFDKEFLPLFEGARKVKPVFSADNTIARFEIVSTPSEVIKLDTSPLLDEKIKDPNVEGYGDDLKAALNKAVASLEAGQIENYLRAMLPVSELKLNDPADLAKRLKQSTAVTKQMIADMKLLAGKIPKMEQGGTLAEFEVVVESPKVRRGDRQPKPVTRVFKFQKTGGHWRLFDNTTAMQKTSHGLSRKLTQTTDTLTLEKIGNQWRISPDDPRFGGKTEHKTRVEKTPYKSEYKTAEKFELPKKRFDEPAKKAFDEKTLEPKKSFPRK
jgi:hypothetical protein